VLSYYYEAHFPKFATIKELQEYLGQVEGMLRQYATTVQAQKHQLKVIRRGYTLKLLGRKRHPRDFPTAFLTLLVEDLEGDILDSLAQEAAEASSPSTSSRSHVVDIGKAKEVLRRSGIGHGGSPLRSPHAARSQTLDLREVKGAEGTPPKLQQQAHSPGQGPAKHSPTTTTSITPPPLIANAARLAGGDQEVQSSPGLPF